MIVSQALQATKWGRWTIYIMRWKEEVNLKSIFDYIKSQDVIL